MDMYKGIGQNFSFHVEMNPFQRDKTAFTLGYTVRILGKHLFFPFSSEEMGKKEKKANIYNAQMQVYVSQYSISTV